MNLKQNSTKDHHYVPVCYLRQFLDPQKQKVATLNVKNLRLNYSAKVKWYAPRQFCYLKDYYTISDDIKAEFKDFNFYDALHIESKLFSNLENSFHKLMDLIIKKRALQVKEAVQFADLIVQMKLRNPYWEQQAFRQSSTWLNEVYPGLEKDFLSDTRFQRYSQEIKKMALQQELLRTRNSPLLNKRLQLFSLIQRNTPGSQANIKIRQAILQSNWILLTANETARFITTDNPGFAVDEKAFHNIKLRGNFRLYFPLSPKHCLMLGEDLDKVYFKKRKAKLLTYRKCSDEMVLKINNAQLHNAFSYAIADNESFLNKIKLIG